MKAAQKQVSTEDFRAYLKRELEIRCQKNPSYSMRAFAKSLGISPSNLSDVLNGRYGLSRSASNKVAKNLGLSAQETNFFVNLVEANTARNLERREQAIARVESYKKDVVFNDLQLEYFRVISDWYHFAILELTALEDFESSPQWIAKQLGIQPLVVKEAIKRLKKVELLEEKNGQLRPTEEHTMAPTEVASEAIKNFHRQVIEKASAALYLQPIHKREYASTLMAIDPEVLPHAKQAIRQFQKEFSKVLAQHTRKPKKQVYCLSVQFFDLGTNSNEEKL